MDQIQVFELTIRLHKSDKPEDNTLIRKHMIQGLRIPLAVLGILSVACLCGTVSAASLGTEWKERPYTDAPFSGVKFSSNGTFVFAGGDQLVLRTWDGQNKWGGRAGSIAMMSDDGAYVVTGSSLVFVPL